MTSCNRNTNCIVSALYPIFHTLTISPMLAAIAMVLSDITVVGNSLLLKRFSKGY